jgi:hypothetical protein
VCLAGLCLGAEHCPSSFACVRSAATDLFGHCTDGAPGQLCATTADCATSTCLIETAGLLGICQ